MSPVRLHAQMESHLSCSMLVLTVLRATAAEESSSEGILVRDKLLLPDSGAANVVFGCETKETGEIYRQQADGLMGLGNSDISVINQVRVLEFKVTLNCTTGTLNHESAISGLASLTSSS